MRIIERSWIQLSQGYQTALSMESRLVSEWKRAIQVAQKRELLVAKLKKRRLQRASGIAFFVFIFLCVSLYLPQFYFPESRLQLLFYQCILILPSIATGILFFYFTVKVSQKAPPHGIHPAFNLAEDWWTSLRPRSYVQEKGGDKGEIDFLHSLAFLGDEYIAVWKLLTSAKVTSDTDVLLLGPNGIWIFEVKYWKGVITKQGGVWHKDFLNKRSSTMERTTFEKSPDEQWLDQKDEISKTIQKRLPFKVELTKIIQGGIVFAHSNVHLEKERIQHPLASYGTPSAWHKRIQKTQPIEGFGVLKRLQVLDALVTYANLHEKEAIKIVSADVAAKRLFDQNSATLRQYVSEHIK